MNEALEALSKQLGLPMGQLWPAAVRFAVTEAIVEIAFSCFMLAATIVATRWAWKRLTAWGQASRDDDSSIPKGVLAVVAMVLFFACVNGVFNSVSTLLNPEGALIMRVLRK